MAARIGCRRQLLFVAVTCLLAYAVFEVGVTGYYWFAGEPDVVHWIFEESGRTVQFDPVRGYRLTTTPSRWARFTYGRLEYVGVLRGNNEGFADRDDFTPKRRSSQTRRVAVFGDSFTSGQYLGQNWPDRAEDLMRERGVDIEFLNFAVDGTGLGNWWSILKGVVEREDYELDAVLFAATTTDLQRTFSFAEDRQAGCHQIGWMPNWDLESLPATVDDIRERLQPTRGFILSSEEFERAMQGRMPSRTAVPFQTRPVLACRAWDFGRICWAAVQGKSATSHPLAHLEPDRRPEKQRLIEEIRQYLSEKNLPTLVVHIPLRETLLDPQGSPTWPREDSVSFAKDLGAEFLDAAEMFAGMSARSIRKRYLPYDAHWNQSGSNRFADFLLERWSWIADRQPIHPTSSNGTSRPASPLLSTRAQPPR